MHSQLDGFDREELEVFQKSLDLRAKQALSNNTLGQFQIFKCL